jgi:hypothetical protein
VSAIMTQNYHVSNPVNDDGGSLVLPKAMQVSRDKTINMQQVCITQLIGQNPWKPGKQL